MIQAKQGFSPATLPFALILALAAASPSPGQEPPTSPDSANPQTQTNPLAELSPENRTLFDSLRQAAQQNDDAGTVAAGKKLLPALKPETQLFDFVTEMTAGSAIETGDTAYALTLLKPFTAAHPDDWRTASLLARAFAESGEKSLRDQQVAHVVALHKSSSDARFSKLHVFPIQKVALRSGYALFLYPFEPLGKFHTYLVALIYTSGGKQDYRLEVESDDVDQALFKPKHPGDRRFSIDSYRESDASGKPGESQALHGFIDGTFDDDAMRDRIIAVANGEKLPTK